MKKLILFLMLFACCDVVLGQPIRLNSATTNREPGLISWISSIVSGPTNGISAAAATNIAAYQALIATNGNFIGRDAGFGTNTTFINSVVVTNAGVDKYRGVVITNGGVYLKGTAGGDRVGNNTGLHFVDTNNVSVARDYLYTDIHGAGKPLRVTESDYSTALKVGAGGARGQFIELGVHNPLNWSVNILYQGSPQTPGWTDGVGSWTSGVSGPLKFETRSYGSLDSSPGIMGRNNTNYPRVLRASNGGTYTETTGDLLFWASVPGHDMSANAAWTTTGYLGGIMFGTNGWLLHGNSTNLGNWRVGDDLTVVGSAIVEDGFQVNGSAGSGITFGSTTVGPVTNYLRSDNTGFYFDVAAYGVGTAPHFGVNFVDAPVMLQNGTGLLTTNGNAVGVTNIPITALQGSGGAGTAASNGTAGLKLTSAGNGGVYWTADATGGSGDTLFGTNVAFGVVTNNSLNGIALATSSQKFYFGPNGAYLNADGLGKILTSGPLKVTGDLEVQGAYTNSDTVTAFGGFSSRSNVITLNVTNAATGLLEANAVDGNTIHTRVNASPTVTTLGATTLNVSGTITGNGSALTNLNASSLASGTVNNARLANVTTNNATLASGLLLGGDGGRGATNVAVGSGLSLAGGTLTATGGGGSVTNTDIVYNYGIQLEDHFIYGNVNASAYLGNFFCLANSGSASIENPPLDTGHVGILTLVTSTSASASPIAYTGLGACVLGARALDAQYIWRIPTASDNTENFQVRIGNYDSNGSTEPTDGVFFRYSNNTNSGALEFVARSNNVESVTNTALAVATGVWYTNRITVDAAATLATIYTNGVVAATLSANIPNATAALARATGLGSFQIIKAAGTTSRMLYCEYWKVKH